MRYIIDVSPKITSSIQELIAQGRYLSVYQFISRAIEEMLHIEEQEINCGEESGSVKESIHSKMMNIMDSNFFELKDELTNLVTPYEPAELYSLENPPWLWGQVNSVLSIKFLLRMIAKKQVENSGEEISVQRFSRVLAKSAVDMGDFLRSIDETQSRPRDAKFSISFPKDSEKSQDRFLSQYFGYLDSNNRPKGALSWLGFIHMTGSRGEENVLLTKAGFHFAKLENPLLDKHVNLMTEIALAEEETNFYINHVMQNVPCESNAFNTICTLIEEGNNTPQKLESALSKEKSKWTSTEVATYKGGALARLYQLRVIKKRKNVDGVLIYELTDKSNIIGSFRS